MTYRMYVTIFVIYEKLMVFIIILILELICVCKLENKMGCFET